MQQRPARILVVDDESAIRFTLDLMLRRRGYLVTTAESGLEALAAIERQAFDLLLLDLKMPGMSGIDIARRAREMLPEAAILILTGSTTIEGLAEAPGLEQFDVLIKTASPQEVLDRVAEVVG